MFTFYYFDFDMRMLAQHGWVSPYELVCLSNACVAHHIHSGDSLRQWKPFRTKHHFQEANIIVCIQYSADRCSIRKSEDIGWITWESGTKINASISLGMEWVIQRFWTYDYAAHLNHKSANACQSTDWIVNRLTERKIEKMLCGGSLVCDTEKQDTQSEENRYKWVWVIYYICQAWLNQ